MQGVCVWSLIRGLRSHMPCGMAKKKRKRKQSRMMSLLQGFHPESQETRAAGPVSSWVWCWRGRTVSLRVAMSSVLKSVGQPAQASQGEDRGRSVLLLAAFATNRGTLIKNGLWFLLDNEVLVFKGWTLIKRKKGMVNQIFFFFFWWNTK